MAESILSAYYVELLCIVGSVHVFYMCLNCKNLEILIHTPWNAVFMLDALRDGVLNPPKVVVQPPGSSIAESGRFDMEMYGSSEEGGGMPAIEPLSEVSGHQEASSGKYHNITSKLSTSPKKIVSGAAAESIHMSLKIIWFFTFFPSLLFFSI